VLVNGKQVSSVIKGCTVLAAVAMPGVYRLILFVIIENLFGMTELGRFANDVSIIFLIGFFTAVGWAGMVMIRVPQNPGIAKLRILFSIARFSFMWLLPSIPLIFLLNKLDIIFNPFLSSVLLVGWTFFMLFRKFFIAIKKYEFLLLAEIILLTCTVVTLIVFKNIPEIVPYLAFAIPCIVMSFLGGIVAFVIVRKDGKVFSNDVQGIARTGFEFGLNNFVGGGKTLALTPLVVHLAGENYGGLLGLLSSLLGIMVLFPRTLSQYHLPDLARFVQNADYASFKAHLSLFRRQIYFSISGICLLSIIVWAALGYTSYAARVDMPGASIVFYLMLLALAVDQVVIPEANSLMVRELSTIMLTVNIGASTLFAVLLVGPFFFNYGPLVSLYMILGAYFVSNVVRSTWLARLAEANLPK
jgi:hypothetical protein